MALNWQHWGRDFLLSLMRHIGTAGMTWSGMSLQDGKLDASDLHSLWIAVLAGAVLPTLFTALQSPPTDIVTVTMTAATAVAATATSELLPPASSAPEQPPTKP